MSKELIVQEAEQLKGLEESKAAQIKAVFQPMVEMLESFEKQFDAVMSLDISPDKCKQAKRLRINVARVRIDADKVRKIQKEEYLRAGNAIQGVYNILKFAVADKEEKLKDVETHFEQIEINRIAKLQVERQLELSKYDSDGEFVELGKMSDEVWHNYFSGVKLNYEAVKEAEKKAEEERVEAERKEAEERARIKAENERLKVEAKKAEKKRLAEQKKLEAERKAQEEKLRAEREKAEAERRIQEEIIRKEREAREDVEREAREKEAERLRLEKEEANRKVAADKKAAAAPDKEKLLSVAVKLRNTKTTVKSKAAIQALENAASLLDKAAETM